MTWDIPEQDLDHSSECLPERWGLWVAYLWIVREHAGVAKYAEA